MSDNKKTITYRGIKTKYIDAKDLAKKLKVKVDIAKELIENATRYVVNDMNEILKLNLETKNAVLLYKEFTNKKRVTNTELLGGSKNKKLKFNVVKTLDNNTPYKLSITITFETNPSGEVTERTITTQLNVKPSNINNELLQKLVEQQLGSWVKEDFKILDYKINTTVNNSTLKLKDMKLYFSKGHLKLNNMFNEIIEKDEWKDCVYDYLHYKYPNKSKKEKENCRTIADIKQFAIKYNIKMIAYDISSNVIESHYPTSKIGKNVNCIFVAYNNHLYPLKNTVLHKTHKNWKKLNVIQEINPQQKFIDILNEGYLPTYIKILHSKITSFIYDDNVYIDNPEYKKCEELAIKLGVRDKLKPSTTIHNFGNILSDVYGLDIVESYLPDHDKFVKGGYNYNNDELHFETEEELETIDMKKCYSATLENLPYLLHTDIRWAKWNKFTEDNQPKKINETSLYITAPKFSTILLPDVNVYTGKHLMYCREENVEFLIREELTCNEEYNVYRKLIQDVKSKLQGYDYKNLFNVMIGKFEAREIMEYQKFVKIVNDDELSRTDGEVFKIGDNMNVITEWITKHNIYCKKPISIQIKDTVRVFMYQMMKALKLKYLDVVQIKTDSLTYFKNRNTEKLVKKFIANGWKYEKYNPIKDKTTTDYDLKPVTFEYTNTKKNTLTNCYAGCGKTHHILNNVIPKSKDYIVLTPAYACLKDYSKNPNINCKVIQKYSSSRGIIPTEKNIYVDEVGMVGKGGWDVLIKASLNGSTISCWGDNRQLPPVQNDKNQLMYYWNELFTSYFFGSVELMNTNYRNKFSIQYYNSLLDVGWDGDKDYLHSEIKKYNSTDWTKAEIIIAWRNSTCDEYNLKMTKHLGFNSMFDKGVKLRCNTSSLGVGSGIYKNFMYEVIESNDQKTKIKLIGNDTVHTLLNKKITSCFKYGYAITLYGVQGATLNSLYWCEEDNNYINGRNAYVLISRLRGVGI